LKRALEVEDKVEVIAEEDRMEIREEIGMEIVVMAAAAAALVVGVVVAAAAAAVLVVAVVVVVVVAAAAVMVVVVVVAAVVVEVRHAEEAGMETGTDTVRVLGIDVRVDVGVDVEVDVRRKAAAEVSSGVRAASAGWERSVDDAPGHTSAKAIVRM
jgi:hypothetical protein